MSKLTEKLSKLDSKYYNKHENLYSYITLKNISHELATYCFDCDFDVSDEGWKLLNHIEKLFGKKIRDKVLYNLFHRNHDT